LTIIRGTNNDWPNVGRNVSSAMYKIIFDRECDLIDEAMERKERSMQVVAVSQSEDLLAVILANPLMIDAYRAGVPRNGARGAASIE
jgi:hypothetical protein